MERREFDEIILKNAESFFDYFRLACIAVRNEKVDETSAFLEKTFEKLMIEISSESIHVFLDFNAVIVNLDSIPLEKQKLCISNIEENIITLKKYLEDNVKEKENLPEIPEIGMAVLQQQFVLVEAIEKWIASVKKRF